MNCTEVTDLLLQFAAYAAYHGRTEVAFLADEVASAAAASAGVDLARTSSTMSGDGEPAPAAPQDMIDPEPRPAASQVGACRAVWRSPGLLAPPQGQGEWLPAAWCCLVLPDAFAEVAHLWLFSLSTGASLACRRSLTQTSA